MARISEKNPRYRTKNQIAQDVAIILSTSVTYGTKYAVVREICWVWTEYTGKYNGCPHWSKKAAMQRTVNPKAKVKHEHLVPKKVVAKMLFELREPTAETVREILDKYLIGVVVSPEEDALLNSEHCATMPKEFFDPEHLDYQNPWLRYDRIGIELVQLKLSAGGGDAAVLSG